MRAGPVARRLLALLLTVLAVHAVAFLLVRAARGGPFDEERASSTAVRQALAERYHLDESLPEQYLRSLTGVLQGDFGPSMVYRDVSVSRILAEGLPLSLALGAGGLLVALLLGVPAGLWAAARRRRAGDAIVLVGSTLAMAVPNFVLAGVGILVFSFALGWLPPAGTGSPLHLLLHITLNEEGFNMLS